MFQVITLFLENKIKNYFAFGFLKVLVQIDIFSIILVFRFKNWTDINIHTVSIYIKHTGHIHMKDHHKYTVSCLSFLHWTCHSLIVHSLFTIIMNFHFLISVYGFLHFANKIHYYYYHYYMSRLEDYGMIWGLYSRNNLLINFVIITQSTFYYPKLVHFCLFIFCFFLI